jgi:hypothetical protein
MPINNVGYREWNGSIRGMVSRCSMIASTGIKIAFKSQWIRRMLIFAWLPVLWIGLAFFFFEQFMDDQLRRAVRITQEKQNFEDIFKETGINVRPFQQRATTPGITPQQRETLRFFFGSDAIVDAITHPDPRVARHIAWCWLLMIFFRYSQNISMLIMVGMIVPPLISRDLRSRAYLMYFSRPIGRLEYLIGKVAVPISFLAMISLIPAIAVFVFGVMLSPGLSVLQDVWEIPLRCLLATAVLAIPTSLLALMFSSLTHESRFAAFAWFAVWGLGEGAYWAITLAQPRALRIAANQQLDTALPPATDWSFLSIFGSVGRIQEWIFGMETNIRPFVIVLGAIVVISTFMLYRRVTAPINA